MNKITSIESLIVKKLIFSIEFIIHVFLSGENKLAIVVEKKQLTEIFQNWCLFPNR